MNMGPTSEAFLRFARAHLGDRAERAVYAVVAAGPPAEWSAGEVAAHAGVSHHQADQVLRRFAAAGIVERVATRPHRYLWAPAMAYLFDGRTGDGDPIDPVCGMPVPFGTTHIARDGDREVRFCSLPCLVRWRRATRPKEA